MVRDLMTNGWLLILFLVVQKKVASLKLTTVFTVTTESFSQNGSEKKFQPQPGIIIILRRLKDLYKFLLIHKTRPVFSEGTETVSFYLICHVTTEKVSHKVDETEC